jgi:hypothetical protein
MTTLGPFQVGQQPVLTATFADVAGGSGVATAVTFMVRNPNGAETTTSSPNAAISNPSSNVWRYTMPVLTVSGLYTVRAESTAGLTAADETTLFVTPSAFTSP